ncbi:hypothetical protein RFI_39685, partial [Reticulomyxa filosa]
KKKIPFFFSIAHRYWCIQDPGFSWAFFEQRIFHDKSLIWEVDTLPVVQSNNVDLSVIVDVHKPISTTVFNEMTRGYNNCLQELKEYERMNAAMAAQGFPDLYFFIAGIVTSYLMMSMNLSTWDCASGEYDITTGNNPFCRNTYSRCVGGALLMYNKQQDIRNVLCVKLSFVFCATNTIFLFTKNMFNIRFDLQQTTDQASKETSNKTTNQKTKHPTHKKSNQSTNKHQTSSPTSSPT